MQNDEVQVRWRVPRRVIRFLKAKARQERRTVAATAAVFLEESVDAAEQPNDPPLSHPTQTPQR